MIVTEAEATLQKMGVCITFSVWLEVIIRSNTTTDGSVNKDKS